MRDLRPGGDNASDDGAIAADRERALRDADRAASVHGELAFAAVRAGDLGEAVSQLLRIGARSSSDTHERPYFAVDVLGSPAPKGSAQAFVVGGRARIVTGGKGSTRARMKAWDAGVREAAAAELGARTEPLFVAVPLVCVVVFRMMRPSGHWGTGKRAGELKPSAPNAPATKPDIDKLARSTLDALTDAVWDDDSRIARLYVAKEYAAPGREGAAIAVGRL